MSVETYMETYQARMMALFLKKTNFCLLLATNDFRKKTPP